MADTRGIRAGRAFVELGVSDKLSAGLRRAQKRLEAFGQGLRSAGTRLAGIGAAAVTALLASVRVFSSMGDVLDKMSLRTGVSAEALSELGFAAEQSGADLETLENGLKFMQRSLVDAAKGSASAQQALSLLGLSVEDLAGLSPDQQFKRLADRLALVTDPALRTALAMEIFGRAGTKLLPLLSSGAAGIEELQAQARSLGLTVSTQTARDAAELNDTLNILWRVVKQGVFAIGGALAPTIKELSQRITRVIVTVTDWIKRNKDLVVWALKVAAGVVVVGAALIGLGVVISGIGAALGVLASVVSGIGAAFGLVGAALGALLSPIGLVVAAVVGLGAALLVTSGAGGAALEWLGEQFTRLRDWATKVIGGISDALAAGDIALAAEILWLSLKVAWQQGVAALSKVWLQAKQFFVGTAQSMWYGALAAAEIGFHAIEVAWIETTAFLSKAWTNFTTGFQQIWESASSWVAKRMLEIQGLFDSGLDVDAAKKAVDQQLESRLVELEDAAQRDVAARERRRATEREQAAAIHEATLAAIGQDFENAQDALRKDTEAGLAESRAALDAAKERLAAAIEEARRKREAADAERGPGGGRSPRDLMAEFDERIAGLGDLLAKGISVRGTFNAKAAQGLAAGSDAAERTARATEQTARHTKRLADAAGTGGLTFG
ncbi:MAG: phage tail tape measure protein [Phycisphaeraceae bacterium]|nr:phage tail tape measure protein [Phycisphaeraceae bacterium]